MEKKNTSLWYNGLIWGLILGFIGVIQGVVFYMLDMATSQANQWIGLGISVVILVFGYLNYRDKVLDGIMPFGKAFTFGFVAMAISAVIGIIYFYLLITVIDPDFHQKLMDMQLDKMLDRGMTEDQAEQAMEFSSRFMSPVMMTIFGLMSSLFFSAIIALVMGAIFSKKEAEA